MIFLDSSVLVDWLRRRELPEQHLYRWLITHEVATCGIVRVEVMRGIVSAPIRDRMRKLFNVMVDVPISNRLVLAAEETAWALDRQGFVLGVSDLLIAEAARQIGATLITRDGDFHRIPGLAVARDLPRR